MSSETIRILCGGEVKSLSEQQEKINHLSEKVAMAAMAFRWRRNECGSPNYWPRVQSVSPPTPL